MEAAALGPCHLGGDPPLGRLPGAADRAHGPGPDTGADAEAGGSKGSGPGARAEGPRTQGGPRLFWRHLAGELAWRTVRRQPRCVCRGLGAASPVIPTPPPLAGAGRSCTEGSRAPRPSEALPRGEQGPRGSQAPRPSEALPHVPYSKNLLGLLPGSRDQSLAGPEVGVNWTECLPR